MYALIAMALALALLVILLQLKVKLGRAMILSSIALAVLLRVTPDDMWQTLVVEWQSEVFTKTTPYVFITLTALIMLVNTFGIAMKETGVSMRLVPALQGLFRSRRAALALVPMMMGLLPTPGGDYAVGPRWFAIWAIISAYRDRDWRRSTTFSGISWRVSGRCFLRCCLPRRRSRVQAISLIKYNIPIAIAGLLSGAVFLLLKGIPPRDRTKDPQTRLSENLKHFFDAFWPILFTAILYATLNITPAAGIFLATIIFLKVHKIPVKQWPTLFKRGIEVDFALLIGGALLFGINLKAGHAIDSVVAFCNEMNVPGYVLVFCLPMLVAFLTGVTTPTIAITFPFLIPFVGTGNEAKLGLEALAFAGVVCGLSITPVHLCLALSVTYFETKLGKIIVKLIGPVIVIAAVGYPDGGVFRVTHRRTSTVGSSSIARGEVSA